MITRSINLKLAITQILHGYGNGLNTPMTVDRLVELFDSIHLESQPPKGDTISFKPADLNIAPAIVDTVAHKIEVVCRALCAANRENTEWMVLPGTSLQTRNGKYVALLNGVEPMPFWRTYWNEAVEVVHALGLDAAEVATTERPVFDPGHKPVV